jgi:hypothetical protein
MRFSAVGKPFEVEASYRHTFVKLLLASLEKQINKDKLWLITHEDLDRLIPPVGCEYLAAERRKRVRDRSNLP